MKLCKYTLTLFLSLVVSYAILPTNMSYAEEAPAATTAPKKNNPFIKNGDFTPETADAAAKEAQLKRAGDAIILAQEKTNAAKSAALSAGVSPNVLSEAERTAKGEESNYAKALKDLLDSQADTTRRGPLSDAANAYLSEYSGLINAQKNLENVNKNGGNNNLYFIDAPDGSAVVYFEKDEKGNFISVGGTSEGCTPLPVKLAESRRCLFCPLFTVLFNAANDMSTKSFKSLAKPITHALIVGFGIFIAFKVMFLVSGFTKQDGPKFISELLTQTFKVFVAIVLLVNSDYIYGYVISPLLKGGLEFGSAFLFDKGRENFELCTQTLGGDISVGDAAIKEGVLKRDFYWKLHCFILSVQVELAVPQAIGSSLMCIAVNAGKDDFFVKNIIPDFSMLIQGLVIWVFSFLVSLAFAFYLIDATVRIGIVGALLPFLIATWPFKMTAKYSNTGFTMLMNTFFVYTFVGIVISINIQLMGNALGGSGGFDKMQNLINGDSVKELKETLDTGAAGFLILIGCCLFGFKLTSQSSALADNLAGGGGGEGIGNKIGGLAASAAKGGAMAAGGAAMSGAKAAGAATGVTQKMTNMKDKAAKAVGQKIGMGRYGGAAGKASKGGGDGDKAGADKAGGDKSGGDKGGASATTASSSGDKSGGDKGGASATTASSGGDKAGESKPDNNK